MVTKALALEFVVVPPPAPDQFCRHRCKEECEEHRPHRDATNESCMPTMIRGRVDLDRVDADTNLFVTWLVGNWMGEDAPGFMRDVAGRLANKV